MKTGIAVTSAVVVSMLFPAAPSFPQAPKAPQGPVEVRRLDSSPYTPGKDPDIDLYLNDWKNSMPGMLHGSFVVREVLSKGDPARPERKGRVLRFVNRFVRAELPAFSSTGKVTLAGEQEIFYILSGNGIVESGGKTAELRDGVFVLIPDKVSYTMRNTGGEALAAYLVVEPVPRTFRPRTEMKVVDGRNIPVSSANGHWSMIIRTAFNIVEDLAVIQYVNLITFDPMTIGHPHAHLPGCEEVWTALEGTSILFLGKQIRMQPPGTAYLCPPYGDCTHSNINHTDKPVRFLYFAVRQDWEKNDGIKRTVE